MNSNFQIITASYGKYFRNRCGKEAGIGRNKKRTCDSFTDPHKYADLSCGGIYRRLGERAAYVGMRCCLCTVDPFGISHLANNMLVLFVLGQRLEPVTGKIKFFLLYIFGGLGGNMLSLFFDMYAGNTSLSAGASGAVFAVMGGMIYVIIRHRGRVADLTVRQMLIMAAFSLYFGFASEGVDNVAHIGGLLSGFLIAVILYHPRKI